MYKNIYQFSVVALTTFKMLQRKMYTCFRNLLSTVRVRRS